MLQPKRTKFRKQFKGRNRGLALVGNAVSFGEYGLKAVSRGRITARQIEAARRAISRHVRRGGKIWIRVFPDKPISKKPLEVRMGKGKGAVEYWVAEIQPGKVLYEMEGVDEAVAREAMALAADRDRIARDLHDELGPHTRRAAYGLFFSEPELLHAGVADSRSWEQVAPALGAPAVAIGDLQIVELVCLHRALSPRQPSSLPAVRRSIGREGADLTPPEPAVA